jgi:phosphoenolpyruvate carboxykinase (GTP)
MRNCPSYSPEAENPRGVPISAIVFGGRRRSLVPLVTQARDWSHGVLMGAAMASETTAAATGQVGVVRRDPMAMKPFCGYHFGDYWAHWLSFDRPGAQLPKIFQVNWFRRADDGHFLWPGFGDNLRVLEWILGRCDGSAGARDTPIGYLPAADDLDLDGLDLPAADVDALLAVDADGWRAEADAIKAHLAEFAPRTPAPLVAQAEALARALAAS